MMSECFTGHNEGHQGSYLPLVGVGGDAGVVAGIGAGDFGEVELAVPLLHVRWHISSVCRGRQRDTYTEALRASGLHSGAVCVCVCVWNSSV